jgi:hypothetical protein
MNWINNLGEEWEINGDYSFRAIKRDRTWTKC